MPSIPRGVSLISSIVLASTLAACAAPPRQHHQYYPSYPQQAYPTEYGRVSRIDVMQVPQGGNTSGGGAVLGGVVGGILGNQIGGGSGRTAATVLGAVGGAVAGNTIEGRMNQGYTQAYRISIQLDQGGMRAYDVSSPGDLRVGDRVRMVNGQISRY